MGTTHRRLKSRIGEEHIAVQRIIDGAKSAGRKLSDGEAAAVNEHRERATSLTADLERSVKRQREEIAIHAQIKQLSDDIGGAPDPSGSWSRSSGRKTVRGAEWAKAVIAQNSDGPRFKGLTSSGTTLVGVPAPPVIEAGRPATLLRSLIPSEPSTGVYQYLRQSTRTNNAAVVAAGARKPTSAYALTRVEGRCRTVAHLTEPINRADLDDAALLSDFLDAELLHGLERGLESEIVNGDASGEHFDGLLHVSGTTPVSFVSGGATDGLDLVLTLRRALTTLELLGIEADGFLLHPSDWESVETAATTTGGLVLAEAGARVPIDAAARRLFGKVVIASPAIAQGTGIAADFGGSTVLYVRDEARIDWSENVYQADAFGEDDGATDFERNMIRFRCEGRFGLAVTRPAGVAVVDLTA